MQRPLILVQVMNRFLVLFGATAGSWVGWYVGAPFGFFGSFIASMFGMGAGWILMLKLRKTYGW